jgi:hypothetical protein
LCPKVVVFPQCAHFAIDQVPFRSNVRVAKHGIIPHSPPDLPEGEQPARGMGLTRLSLPGCAGR